MICAYDRCKSSRKRVHRERHPTVQKTVRKGWYLSRVAEAGTLREAEREKKKEGYRGKEESPETRAPFVLRTSRAVNKSVESKAEIQNALKTAMKSGDRITVSTLRLLLSAIYNEEIRARKQLDGDEIKRIISTLRKQRAEAIALFRKGGREDLAEKEENELKILERFLPQPMTDEEVRTLIQDCIVEANAKGAADLGRVMKLVMSKVSGRSEGKRVSELAREILASQAARQP